MVTFLNGRRSGNQAPRLLGTLLFHAEHGLEMEGVDYLVPVGRAPGTYWECLTRLRRQRTEGNGNGVK